MNCLLQIRRYRLPLSVAVRTAHGVMTEREGILVRLEEDKSGRVGFGEVAPLPEFGTETVDEAAAVLRMLGERVTAEQMATLGDGGTGPASRSTRGGPRLGCVRFALAGAQAPILGPPAAAQSRPVAALLPAGRAALEKIATLGEAGFRTFKWKVGVAPVAEELPLLDDLCAELPPGARLRLDANGAWDRRAAERWLERCAERPVEYVEQPCFAPPDGASPGTLRQARMEDLLRGLAEDYPTTLALDESLAGPDDLERWLAAGWRGVFVIKLALLGDPWPVLARLRAAQADVVFSSGLETAVGAQTALRAALAWEPGLPAGQKLNSQGSKPTAHPVRALGFGVWPLFADPRFDGPWAAPFIHPRDVEGLNVEVAWNALS